MWRKCKWEREQSAASSGSPACEKRRMWVLMSVLTPGQLGATFRCISPWAVCRAHVTRVDFKATRLKVCLSAFLPIWLSGNINANCSRLRKAHKIPPPPQPTVRTNTRTSPRFYTACDLLKGEKLFCWHAANHNGGQRLYMHSLYVHQSAAPVGGS